MPAATRTCSGCRWPHLRPQRPDARLAEARQGEVRGVSEWARTRYKRVLFMGGGGTDLLSHSYGVKAVWSDRYQVPEFQSALNALPRSVRQKEFEDGIYEFVTAAPRADLWFDLDVWNEG